MHPDSVNVGPEKIKNDLNWPEPLASQFVLMAKEQGLIRCEMKVLMLKSYASTGLQIAII